VWRKVIQPFWEDGQKKGVIAMKEESTNRKSSILMPALIGSSVGAGIAVLLAPQSGKKTRKDMKRFAAKTRDQVAEVIDEGKDLYEDGSKVVARTVKAGREMYDVGTEKIEKLMHKKERSIVVPILTGGIIGAGIALLLTPKSGKEVRENLKRIATDTRDTFVSAVDRGKALYMKMSKDIPKAVKDLRHAA
jgi:gas vesicle protein